MNTDFIYFILIVILSITEAHSVLVKQNRRCFSRRRFGFPLMGSANEPMKASSDVLSILPSKNLKERGKIAKYSPEKRLFRSTLPESQDPMLNKHTFPSQYEAVDDFIKDSVKPSFDLTWNALSELHQKSPLDCMNCNKLLKNLGDQGKLDKCELLFEFMVSNRIRRTIITFNTIISRAGNWKNVDIAEKYFNILKDSSIGIARLKPDEQIYNSMINAYSKSEMIEKAFSLFKEMQFSNVSLSAITFNTLLDACSRLGAVQRAEEVLSLMKSNNVNPDIRTYSSLVQVRCAAGNITAALKILQEMELLNMEASPITYSIILDALGRKGFIAEAFKMLGFIRSKGVAVNVVTLSSMLHACAKSGRLNDAFTLYHDMLNSSDSNRRPNSITCSSLIDACLKVGEVDRAYSVLKDMNTYSIPLTTVTYTSLITELTKLKMLDKILEFTMQETKDNPLFVDVKANASFSFPKTAKTLTGHTTAHMQETLDTVRLQKYGENLLGYFERIDDELRRLSRLVDVENPIDVVEISSFNVSSLGVMATAFLDQSQSTSQILDLIRLQSESDVDSAFDLSLRHREYLSSMFQTILESQDKARRIRDAQSLLSSKFYALSALANSENDQDDRSRLIDDIKSSLTTIAQPTDMAEVFLSEYENLKMKGVS
jgi:pentatricopeptide repeat protein